MAISRLSVRVVRRSNSARLTAGNVVAAAAYASREALYDERLRETHNYTHRSADLVASEVLLPPLAPYRWFDREVLWNEVEWNERRSDARLAHAVVLTLPRELDATAGAELARDFLDRTVVRGGVIADMAVHTKTAADGGPQPHAHALLTMRRIVDKAFGRKDFAWVGADVIREWREQWAEMANRRLAEHGISARLDHRPIRSAVRTAARVAERATERVAEVATLARAAAIIGAAVVTHAAREAVRRVVPRRRERKQVDMPTNKFVPRTPIEELKDELRRPLRAAAVGVATGVSTYGDAVDKLVRDHLSPVAARYPELESRFDELEEKIGNALTKSVTRVETQISGNAALLQARTEHREMAMDNSKRVAGAGLTPAEQAEVTAMPERGRRVVPASVAARHEAQEPSRRAQEASQRSHVAVME